MLIDLTHTFDEQIPVYPGDPATEIRPAGILARNGFQDHYVCCGTHVGTHMDAPSHMIAGGKNLDQLPVEQFTGPGTCINVDGGFSLELVKNAPIKEGDVVFFCTGMDAKYHEAVYFNNYPVMTPEVAEYLVSKNVKIVGTDTCSPDGPGSSFPIHDILLGNGVLIIENLTGLRQLAGKRFEIYAFPLKYALDGAPVRVIARV